MKKLTSGLLTLCLALNLAAPLLTQDDFDPHQ